MAQICPRNLLTLGKNLFSKKFYFLPKSAMKCFGLEMTSPTMPDLIKKSPFGSHFYSDLKLIDQLFLKMIRMDPIYNSDVATGLL